MRIDQYANRTVTMDISYFNRDMHNGAMHMNTYSTLTSNSKMFDEAIDCILWGARYTGDEDYLEQVRELYTAHVTHDYRTLVNASYKVRHITNFYIDMYQINVRTPDGNVVFRVDTGKGSPVLYSRVWKDKHCVKRVEPRIHRRKFPVEK